MILGAAVAIGLIGWAGADPVLDAFKAAGWGVAVVCILRAVALAAAGLGWLMLFPPG
jgi:hypothetical protein